MARPIGGYITNKDRDPTSSSAGGIWTLSEVLQYKVEGRWPIDNLPPLNVEYLVVGGGGGGGETIGGGGGGGVVNTGSFETTREAFFSVTVGAGGLGGFTGVTGAASYPGGYSGNSSTLSGTGVSVTSAGGGAGGGYNSGGTSPGSSGGGHGGGQGAGGGAGIAAGSGLNAGGTSASNLNSGAGGGGSDAAGSNSTSGSPGAGGAGVSSSITGSAVNYAGGGGGGARVPNGGTAAAGGAGGGGAGGTGAENGTDGTPNSGGGGGGGGYRNSPVFQGAGGSGGSGVVILKYPQGYTISNPDGLLTLSTPAASGGFKVTSITAGTGNVTWGTGESPPPPSGPTITFVGSDIVFANESVNYSTLGATTGDLAIAIQHAFSGFTPTGYTEVFTTTGDPFNYLKRVSYRVLQAGDTSVTVNNDTVGFSSSIVILRGASSVSNTYAWSNATAGGSVVLNVAEDGALIAIGSDRGATAGQSPTIVMSSGSFSNTRSESGVYFSERHSINLDYTSGTNITFTDYNDVYGSNFLAIVAT